MTAAKARPNEERVTVPSNKPAGKVKKRGGLLLAFLVFFQLLYMTIPPDDYSLTPPPAPAPVFANKNQAAPTPVVNEFAPNPVSRFIKIFLIVVSAAIVVSNSAESLRLLKNLNLFFRIFLVVVPASVLWSISRVDTLNRYMSIMTELLLAMAFCVSGWHARRFQNVLRPTITVLLIGSIILGLTIPGLAIEQGIGTLKDAWRGLTVQKNEFGQLAGFGALLWLHGLLTKESKWWNALIFGGLAYYCVLLSRSSTSLMATLFASLFMLIALRSTGAMRRYLPYLVGILAIAVLTYALAVLNLIPGTSILLEPIAALTGKDMTFSNRSTIWDIIKEHIQLSPLLGSGYGAYWIGPVPNSPSSTFLWRMYFYPTESHNGYLEIVNDLGYVGLVILVGYLFMYIRQCLQLMKVDRNQSFLFLGLFFLESIANLSESTWLVINSGFIFFVITLAVVVTARSLMEAQQNTSIPSAANPRKRAARAAGGVRNSPRPPARVSRGRPGNGLPRN